MAGLGHILVAEARRFLRLAKELAMTPNPPCDSSTAAAKSEEEIRAVLWRLLRLVAAEVAGQLRQCDQGNSPLRKHLPGPRPDSSDQDSSG
jgi:hypothetical protein